MATQNADFKNIRAFNLNQIKLEDDFYLQITQKDVDFLNTFDPERLLFNFRRTAGLPPKCSGPYSGWENTRIGGHTLGHYLAAAAQGYACGYGECTGKDGLTLTKRISILIDGLAECQDALGTGFIFGATMADSKKPELQFDKLEAGTPADTWVPWYTMHKIMNGLVETVKLCPPEISGSAMDVAAKLGEWIYNRTSKWTAQERSRVLGIEYGAMNDCMYELYKCAKKAKYKKADHFLQAAHAFDDEDLFQRMNISYKVPGMFPEVLNNQHANCTIPKFLGAINRCVTLIEDGTLPEEQKKYFEYAASFWEIVVNHHTYITGGNSECEHFGKENILDAERSNCNCETCNTHNMLKLTRTLFMLTGNKKYADYYENTFVNAILASVNAETGMTTYFQPMATGCFKTYCNPDVNRNYFWCCTGTGLENFTKLGDSFYFYDDETLYVNQYASSSVEWAQKNIILTQKSAIPYEDKASFVIKHVSDNKNDDKYTFTIALRIPDWAAQTPQVCLNGNKIEISTEDLENGYIKINRSWQNDDEITLKIPMQIKAFSLPDNPKSYAFKYGPVVLAAELGKDSKMTLRQVGVQCDVSANKIVRGLYMALNGNYGGTSGLKPLATETILVNSTNLKDFMDDINSHFERETFAQNNNADQTGSKNSVSNSGSILSSKLSFILKDTNWPETFRFSPYYLINNQRYGIYWLFTDSKEEFAAIQTLADQASKDAEKYIEGIGIGYGAQTEGNETTYPFMKESGNGSVADPHALTRYAKAGGSFSYIFKVLPDKDICLDCTFLKEDEGKIIRIASGETLIAEYTVNSKNGTDAGNEKFSQRFELARQLTEGKKEIRISFSANDSADSARLAAPVSTSWK